VVLVHLTSQRNVARIRRRGIAMSLRGRRRHGVYAMPVSPSFYLSHQWLRELRRGGAGAIVGVYFRIADDERVEVGHYNSGHVAMTAAGAAGLIMAAGRDAEGYEVIIPRRISASEIRRVKALPQVVGWRYFPASKGKRPCACLCCERGAYGIQKLQSAVEKAEARGQVPKISLFGREDDSFDRVERLRAQRRRRAALRAEKTRS
jgi:hypothetical protein